MEEPQQVRWFWDLDRQPAPEDLREVRCCHFARRITCGAARRHWEDGQPHIKEDYHTDQCRARNIENCDAPRVAQADGGYIRAQGGFPDPNPRNVYAVVAYDRNLDFPFRSIKECKGCKNVREKARKYAKSKRKDRDEEDDDENTPAGKREQGAQPGQHKFQVDLPPVQKRFVGAGGKDIVS
jgi:hypothetical protein